MDQPARKRKRVGVLSRDRRVRMLKIVWVGEDAGGVPSSVGGGVE